MSSFSTRAIAGQKVDLEAVKSQARACYLHSDSALRQVIQNISQRPLNEDVEPDGGFSSASQGSSRVSAILNYGRFVNYVVAIRCTGSFDADNNPIATYCIVVSRNASRVREEDDDIGRSLISAIRRAMNDAGTFVDAGSHSNSCD
ncbi:hypothetical protein [Adonisia turfae]|nr:hypothetical protein [Adonisia turfae]